MAYDSSTDMQTITDSAAILQIQNSLKALDRTSGTPPTNLVDYNDTRFELFSFTRVMDAASGAVTYNLASIAKTPKAILFFGGVDSATGNFFFISGATTSLAGYVSSISAAIVWTIGTSALNIVESASLSQSAVLTSFAAGQFTLTWTRNGVTSAGTATVKCLVFV